MLGHVHGGQPTVTLRVLFTSRKVNAWICARRSTDRDLESQREFFCECLDMSSTDRDLERVSASFCVNAWIYAARSTDCDPDFYVKVWTCPHQATDRDLQSASAIEKKGECLDMCTSNNRP